MIKEINVEKVLKGRFKVILITMIILIFSIIPICSASNLITDDFEINYYISSGKEYNYGSYIDDENFTQLSIEAKKYNLPSNLYEYRDDIRFRITYSINDYEVYDCKVINYNTGEIIQDLSEENIERLFNIEYGKSINENNWVDTIKLSQLTENQIYKYTANSTVQFPKIENDVDKNCMVYIKDRLDDNYKREIYMNKEISSSSISLSFNEYQQGEGFNIMYKSISNEELLKLIEDDEIIYLSKFKDGEQLDYNFEKYIYNDTDKDIEVNTKDVFFDQEVFNTYTIRKGEIHGFSWMIDYASIDYIDDSTDKQTWINASQWAIGELENANIFGLIPEKLKYLDLTKNITRDEFASITVCLYEKISGKEIEKVDNPFIDTNDQDVIKAYAIGVTNGVSKNEFKPNNLITREEMATMMIRVLNKLGIDTKVEKIEEFVDDDIISDWAKEGVYYMSSVGIIKGMGENKFGAKEQATREQAIIISLRSRLNF